MLVGGDTISLWLAHAGSSSTTAHLDWVPHFEVWVVFTLLGAAYFQVIKRLGPNYVSPGDPPATRRQQTLFVAGLAVAWIFADWPIHELSEDYLFSVHMVQHLAFSFISAPLLIMGTPGWLVRRVLSPKSVKRVFRFLTRPVVALLIFNSYLVFSHWPKFVNTIATNEPVHALAHVVLFFTAFIMWWPVLSPTSEFPRISHPAQLLYLFLQTIVPTVPASFLTFADFPFYQAYIDAPRIISMSALTDQRVAGMVMKIGGGFFLWTVIAVLFFRWSSREASGQPDELDWQDIELQMNPTHRVR